MGSGKTTIGIPLATALHCPFVDNDAQLFQRTGTTAAELAARGGVDALHAAEAEAVRAALAAPDPSVIAALKVMAQVVGDTSNIPGGTSGARC